VVLPGPAARATASPSSTPLRSLRDAQPSWSTRPPDRRDGVAIGATSKTEVW